VNLLLVAYFFPPCGDTGAARPAAMAKHLERLGHRVTVLTTSAYGTLADDAQRGVFRTTDAQLWRARLQGAQRVGSLYDSDSYSGRPHLLSRLLVPEPLVAAWAPFARRRALRLQGARRFDCVITSSPPESVHLIGRSLRRRGTPWVADVRDAWTFEPLRPRFPTPVQRALDERLERRWLGAADAVVCVSEPAAADLRARGIADPHVIANGWDPDSAPAAGASSGVQLDPGRISLVYTGRFGSYGRDPAPLLDAIARLAADEPELARRIELVVAGPLTDAERALFARHVSPARIVLAGSLPRERALALQREADALLLIAHPTRSQLLNYKLFEYLAAGRPILALAGGTEAGRVARSLGAEVVRADDREAIVGSLRELAEARLRPPPRDAVTPYTYPGPAEAMAAAAGRAIRAFDSSVP